MKPFLPASILSTAIALTTLSGCDRPKGIKTSPQVAEYTADLIVRINEVLEVSPEGKEIRDVLKQLGAPAVCTIMTEIDGEGVSDSRIYCQTGPLPASPKGKLAIVGPVVFPTTLGARNHLSTIGVHLEDGVFDPSSGCSIYEVDATREVIGSNESICKDINERAAEIIEQYERLIDEGLRGNGRTI